MIQYAEALNLPERTRPFVQRGFSKMVIRNTVNAGTSLLEQVKNAIITPIG